MPCGIEPGLAVLGEDRDHAAGGVAVERREGPAQHFDVIGRAEIELRELALPVGHGARNAIGVQPHAAHAEARARAEAAHGELQILRVVLAALHGDARHLVERLGQVDLQLTLADLLRIDAVDRDRQIKARLRDARRRDDDLRERLRVGAAPALRGAGR